MTWRLNSIEANASYAMSANLMPPIARADGTRNAFLKHRNASPRIFPVREFWPFLVQGAEEGGIRGEATQKTFAISIVRFISNVIYKRSLNIISISRIDISRRFNDREMYVQIYVKGDKINYLITRMIRRGGVVTS